MGVNDHQVPEWWWGYWRGEAELAKGRGDPWVANPFIPGVVIDEDHWWEGYALAKHIHLVWI